MKLLIIEDDQDLARNLRKGLSEEGYVVDTAFTGVEGQELAENFDFDAIILDLGLPDKDGIEVCRSLREKKIDAKILALTGRAGIADRTKDWIAEPMIIWSSPLILKNCAPGSEYYQALSNSVFLILRGLS